MICFRIPRRVSSDDRGDLCLSCGVREVLADVVDDSETVIVITSDDHDNGDLTHLEHAVDMKKVPIFLITFPLTSSSSPSKSLASLSKYGATFTVQEHSHSIHQSEFIRVSASLRKL